jgi:hypothetical protein
MMQLKDEYPIWQKTDKRTPLKKLKKSIFFSLQLGGSKDIQSIIIYLCVCVRRYHDENNMREQILSASELPRTQPTLKY